MLLLALNACGGVHGFPRPSTPNKGTPSTRAEVDARIRELVNLKGAFRFGDAVYGVMVNDATIEEIAAADTIGIRSLVACLSDDRRTHVTLHGRRVTVGRLCGEALIGTAYVQTGLQRRGFPESWLGMPSLTDDSLDLGLVQRVWSQWLHEHALVWPKLAGAALACPAPGSNRVERSTPKPSPSALPRADGKVVIHLREHFPHYRFTTFVIDSEFVILSDSRADPTRGGVLDDLSPDDIQSITIEKPESEAWKWRACEGVPIVLIVTKSKRWRPRTPH